MHTEAVAEVCRRITTFAQKADRQEARLIAQELTELVEEWREAVGHAAVDGKLLYYRTHGKGQNGLIGDYKKNNGLWEIPNSMRNVDLECLVIVQGAGK